MRDRLIELLKQKACPFVHCDRECGECKNVEMYDDSIEVIADHLLAAGVIVPPCKVGQKVYVLRSQTSNGKNLYMREERISHYRLFGDYSVMCFESQRLGVFNHRWKEDVFLTKEEAEKALAERRESDG